MKRKMLLLAFLAALVFGLAETGLAQDLLNTVTPPLGVCNAKWGLGTSQNAWPGYVTISTDCNNLYLSFNLWPVNPPQPTFGALHIWLGNNLFNLPLNSQGMPDASQFCSALNGKCINATGLTSYTWVVPFSELNLVDITNFYNTNRNHSCPLQTKRHEAWYYGGRRQELGFVEKHLHLSRMAPGAMA